MSHRNRPTDKRRSGKTAEAGRDDLGSDHPDRRAAWASTPRSISRTREVAECHSTSSIFRGYSIFMKGKDPRDAHFITSRICGICGDNHATCAVYAQNMAFGVQPPPLAEWIVNLGEAAEYMFDHNIFQDNLVGVDFCEQMVKETNPASGRRRKKTEAPHADRPRLPHDRRHHDRAQSVHRRVLSRDAADEPLDARDVLPDGRPARPSVDALSGRRRHGAHRAALHRLPGPADEVRRVHEEGRAAARRPVRLLLRGAARLREGRPAPHAARLLGLVQQSGRLRLHLQEHDELGRAHVRHAGRRRRRQAGHQRPGRHQPGHPHSAGQFVLRRLGERARPSSRPIRSATRSTSAIRGTRRPSPSRRSATSTGKYTWVMSPRWFDRRTATTWRSTPAADRSPASGRRRSPGWWTSATSRRPATA